MNPDTVVEGEAVDLDETGSPKPSPNRPRPDDPTVIRGEIEE